MNSSVDALRRWLGMFFLVLAGGMLIWGQTILKSWLTGWGFLLYWGLCFLFTIGAIFFALLDLRSVRQRTRREQQELLKKTLRDAERTEGKDSDEGQ